MTAYNFGDVILVPFPFTDQSQAKQRPAVVVSSALRIPVDAGHQFRSMPGRHSGPCRATVPVDAGRGV